MNKKTIWITGGSTGIGKALAIKFSNKGWNVAEARGIYIATETLEKDIDCILSNSFGFGGTNASLVISKYQ